MTELPRILAQEEEDIAKGCKKHPDILSAIHNNAGKLKNLIQKIKSDSAINLH